MLEEEPRETAAPAFIASAKLVCAGGADIGRTFGVDGADSLVLGRGRVADIALAGEEVSRRHAEIRRVRDEFSLIDLGSRNGTTVNGVVVVGGQSRLLRPGDRIQLGGGTLLIFTLADELKDRAIQINQLNTLAVVTGGIVHDFKNSLGVVLANADMLDTELAAANIPPSWREMLADILLAARGGLQSAQRLLYFARRDSGDEDWEHVEVGGLVQEVLALVKRPLEKARVRAAIDLGPPCIVRGHRYELHHAILNLILNARDAMPDGGRLTLDVARLTLSRSDAVLCNLGSPGEYVEVSVADTGIGMDAETQARIFEPFFTTKPTGQGTGLGLSSVFGIVRNHGGSVSVESAPGKGARFRVRLPLVTSMHRATTDVGEDDSGTISTAVGDLPR